MLYFQNTKWDIESMRAEYRRLCLAMHPDKGGSHEAFVEMKNEYDEIIGRLAAHEAGTANAEKRAPRYTRESEKEFCAAIERFLNIPGIVVEICGSWLWISGNTFPVHEQIKNAGAKFSGNKKMWYWAATMAQGKVHGHYSMNKIRSRFGSERIESTAEEMAKIAA